MTAEDNQEEPVMNWDEQLQSIKLKTLFKLGGKLLLASLVWIVLLFIIVVLLMYAFARFTTLW